MQTVAAQQWARVWHKLNKYWRAYISVSNTSEIMVQWLSGMRRSATFCLEDLSSILSTGKNYFVIKLHRIGLDWIGLSISNMLANPITTAEM